MSSEFAIKYNKQAVQDQKTKLLIKSIHKTFDRCKGRDAIEKRLEELGFIEWFNWHDDYLYGLDKVPHYGLGKLPQNLFIYISWINSEAWILFRINKINI